MNRNTMRVWASSTNAEVTDPDLDVDHPGGQGGNQKYEHGWIVEKEPHQWANFIYSNVDLSIKELLENGTLLWDSTVTYKTGSLLIDNGYVFRAKRDNIECNPANSPDDWELVPKPAADDFESFLTMLETVLNAHVGLIGPQDNVHQTTAHQANTYTIDESDAKIKVVKDDLSYHESQTNPHNLNAGDVGCLDKTKGGHFTGVVVYGAGVKFGAGEYGIDSDGLSSPNDSFSIVNSVPYQKTSKQEIVTDGSYNRINIEHNFEFAVPTEDILIMLVGDLSSLSQGNYTIGYGRSSVLQYVDRSGNTTSAGIDAPPFGEMGLILTSDTTLVFSGLMSGTKATMCYVLNNETIIKTVDVSSDNLISYIGTSGQIRNIQIWLTPLTEKQESMLGG